MQWTESFLSEDFTTVIVFTIKNTNSLNHFVFCIFFYILLLN